VEGKIEKYLTIVGEIVINIVKVELVNVAVI
jgi:hypothetical protein